MTIRLISYFYILIHTFIFVKVKIFYLSYKYRCINKKICNNCLRHHWIKSIIFHLDFPCTITQTLQSSFDHPFYSWNIRTRILLVIWRAQTNFHHLTRTLIRGTRTSKKEIVIRNIFAADCNNNSLFPSFRF